MENNKEKTQYYRIQGRITMEEREDYLRIKKDYEERVLNGVKLTDGMFLMVVVREFSRLNNND
ncbi:TPA: hypothetical protein ACL3X7_002106 [Streptococcus pneumoniae]